MISLFIGVLVCNSMLDFPVKVNNNNNISEVLLQVEVFTWVRASADAGIQADAT